MDAFTADNVARSDGGGQFIPLNDEVQRLALHQAELLFYVAVPPGKVAVGFLIAGQEFVTVAPCEGTEGGLGLGSGYHQYTVGLLGI